MAAFSRLQLAAALIEYDNDLEDTSLIQRSANDSAIFSHLRKRNLNPRTKAISGLGNDANHLQAPAQDTQQSRKSRASISTLQNPFRGDLLDEEEPEEEKEEEPEVDLSSWGLDAILPQRPKEKHHRKPSHAKTIELPILERRLPGDTARSAKRRHATTDEFGAIQESSSDPAIQRPPNSWDHGTHPSNRPSTDKLAGAHGYPGGGLHGVPFPHSSGPLEGDAFAPPLPPVNRASRFDPKVQAHARTVSVLSRGSELLSPGSDHRSRTVSAGTLATMGSQPPRLGTDSVSQIHVDEFGTGRYRTRTASNASFGSQQLIAEAEFTAGEAANDHQYTRGGLLRPKVLVMPSPLQSADAPPTTTTPGAARDGFQLSQNGFPFPAGAQTTGRDGARPLSSLLSSSAFPGTGSNPFTANPRQSLTLSQLTFRNSLMVGGQRDVAYADIEEHLSRAQEEGEQVLKIKEEGEEEEEEEAEEKVEEKVEGRPAGKLFGKSLIDDLEARKTEMRSKQRTFMGDQRVSMMARTQPTLVDLNEPSIKPSNSQQSGSGHSNSRRRTLLELADNNQTSGTQGRVVKSTSVFGVDTVWERELRKLKEIEEQEAAMAAEETRRKEAARAAELAKKGKGKGSKQALPQGTDVALVQPISEEPPTIPAFVLRPQPQVVKQESDSDTDSDDVEEPDKPLQSRMATWYAGESDERIDQSPFQRRELKVAPVQIHHDDDDDDLPLNQVSKELLSKVHSTEEEEEEDKPLSFVLEKIKRPSGEIPKPSSNEPDDDDEVPLAIRRLTTIGMKPSTLDDDDDRPLGLKLQAQWPIQQVAPQYGQGFPMLPISMGPPSIMSMAPLPFLHPPGVPGSFFGPSPQDPINNDFGKIDAWRRNVE